MRYKLTALTPLLVGDGRELSPIDYMVWKDQVNVLDQNRIFKLLARGPRLEGYLAQLRKATKLDFASWGGFAQNFSQRRIPFENAEATAIWNAASSEALFIPTFTANYNGPYLPASALKGALRTGLVFSRWSPATIDRITAAIENDRLPRRISEATENTAGASQMRILAAADSQPVPVSAFKIYLSRTASLNGSQLVWKVTGRGNVPPNKVNDATPVFAEMATPGTVFSGQWQERTFLENSEFTKALGWRSVPNVKVIVDASNEYAAAQIDIHRQYAEAAGLASLQKTVDRLKNELATAQSSPLTCLVSLGWGSGFLSKTAFLQTGNESYQKILRTVPAMRGALRQGAIFPKTRRIVFSGGQPATLAGWSRVQFETE